MLYEPDLAHIHIDGYGFHWEGAAPAILSWLRDAGLHRGTIVDVGCGGGQWLARLAAAGYKPVGIDVSPAMIRHARTVAPSAKLICGSIDEIDVPACDAVTSLGEPLNYLANARRFKRAIQHVYRALRPGGLFVFDVRERAKAPVDKRIAARVGADWACIAEVQESPANGQLVRQITAFRRRGKSYRRSEERHVLRLYSRRDMWQWLRAIGFRVRTYRGYGGYRLGPRQIVMLARKP